MKTPLSTLFLALCAACSSVACGPSFELGAPPGFVTLDDETRGPSYDFRATTPDGLVLAVREIEHRPHGDQRFWVRAIENEMRARGGYALLDERAVRTAQGFGGQQLVFGHDEGEKAHLYEIFVFVTDDFIYLVEAGGKRQLVEQQRELIDQAIAGLSLD